MQFTVKSGAIEKQRSACLVVGIYHDKELTSSANKLDKISKGYLKNILKQGDLQERPGQTLLLHNVPGIASNRVLLVSCGKKGEADKAKYRRIICGTINALNKIGVKEAICCLTELSVKECDFQWKVRHAIDVTRSTNYRFNLIKNKKKSHIPVLKNLILSASNNKEETSGKQAARIAQAISNGMSLAKDLGNLPGNICTPTYLANQARKLGKGNAKLKINVLSEKNMEALKMDAFLSVSRGSDQPAKLITLNYSGGKKNDKPVVLVGKGVTFDSGGISIKPSPAMDEMKYDMCGAASVLGTILAITELQLPINVVGVIPSTENMPNGSASKPGDIVTSMSGQTIEILNTDAEGRLILCDALTYSDRFNPETVIDIATLTGACVIALGAHASGLLSNDNALAKDLLDAGNMTYDRAWEMPLWDEYQHQLHSNFADMANIGGREAGTVTAACFLSRFTKKYQWAHLDIAGTAWLTGGRKGATGRPVPLLTQYLIDRCK